MCVCVYVCVFMYVCICVHMSVWVILKLSLVEQLAPKIWKTKNKYDEMLILCKTKITGL